MSSSELDALIAAADADPSAPYVDTITVDEDAHLVLPSGSVVHFCNHSCDPTAWHAGLYELTARRDLDLDEELTIDYGTHSGADGFVMTCRCGARECRGRISSEDWRLPVLQDRYVGPLGARAAAAHRRPAAGRTAPDQRRCLPEVGQTRGQG